MQALAKILHQKFRTFAICQDRSHHMSNALFSVGTGNGNQVDQKNKVVNNVINLNVS